MTVTFSSTLIHTSLWHSHPLTNLNSHPFITQWPSHQPSIPLYDIFTLSSTLIHTPLSQSPSYQPFIHTPLSHSHPLIDRPRPFITVTLSSTVHMPLSQSPSHQPSTSLYHTVTLSSTVHLPLSYSHPLINHPHPFIIQSPSHQPSTSLYHSHPLINRPHPFIIQSPSHQPSTSLYHSHPLIDLSFTPLCKRGLYRTVFEYFLGHIFSNQIVNFHPNWCFIMRCLLLPVLSGPLVPQEDLGHSILCVCVHWHVVLALTGCKISKMLKFCFGFYRKHFDMLSPFFNVHDILAGDVVFGLHLRPSQRSHWLHPLCDCRYRHHQRSLHSNCGMLHVLDNMCTVCFVNGHLKFLSPQL